MNMVIMEVSGEAALGMGAAIIIFWLSIWIGIAWLCGSIAAGKGHSFGGFFVLGLLFSLLGLVLALVISDNRSRYERPRRLRLARPQAPALVNAKRFDCPECGESIPLSARTCRFCNAQLSQRAITNDQDQ